jgi:hypothetical protein
MVKKNKRKQVVPRSKIAVSSDVVSVGHLPSGFNGGLQQAPTSPLPTSIPNIYVQPHPDTLQPSLIFSDQSEKSEPRIYKDLLSVPIIPTRVSPSITISKDALKTLVSNSYELPQQTVGVQSVLIPKNSLELIIPSTQGTVTKDSSLHSLSTMHNSVTKDSSSQSQVLIPHNFGQTVERSTNEWMTREVSELTRFKPGDRGIQDKLHEIIAKYLQDIIGKHCIYRIPSDILIAWHGYYVNKWNGNREAERHRIDEIRKDYETTGYMNGTIALAFTQSLVCYDGNHRREALIPGMCILVDIMWNAKDEDVVHDFDRINKAVSVPRIFTDRTLASDIKDTIINFVNNELIHRYRDLYSTNASCTRPFFRKDPVIQQIHEMLVEFNCDVQQLLACIRNLNLIYSKREWKPSSTGRFKLTQNKIDKCHSTGLWLFLLQDGICVEDVYILVQGRDLAI